MAKLIVDVSDKTKAKIRRDARKYPSIKDYVLWRLGVADLEKGKAKSHG